MFGSFGGLNFLLASFFPWDTRTCFLFFSSSFLLVSMSATAKHHPPPLKIILDRPRCYYAAVNCKTHYRTPGNSASWMGHLPHISGERYRLGSLWSVTTLTNECVNDGHFTWVRPFPMTYDTVVGGIEKSRHAKCVRSAWPVCIDSVARCGSSTTCASMELARCGSSATCASMELQSFPYV